MTLIEFYDENPIENLSGALTVPADKIIFLGHKKVMEKITWEISNFLKYRGFAGEIVYIHTIPHELDSVMEVLEDILSQNKACTFDVTGGDDLTLFAFGRVFERHSKNGTQIHWLNVRTGRTNDLGATEQSSEDRPFLTVDENIMLHGGVVVYEDIQPGTTYEWDLNEDFLQDVATMWEICCGNAGQWNYQTSLLAKIETINAQEEDTLLLEVDSYDLYSHFDELGIQLNLTGIFPKLYKEGLLTDYYLDTNFFRVRYKDEQVKRCLTKAGAILELKTYILAISLKDSSEHPLFSDGKPGVYIDWDGQVHEWWEDVDTTNEIDVILTKGMVPVFISCKNGTFSVEELYKLCTVADKFGAGYAKKCLVFSDEEKIIGSKEHLFARAEAMGVELIGNVASLSDAEFAKRIRKLVC